MGKKDMALYRYFQDEDRIADLLDVYVFGGRRVIRGADIYEKDSRVTGIFGRLRRRLPVQKYRDLIRRVALNTDFVIVGLEHQAEIHYAMPVRVMFEDAANYDEQLRKIQKLHRRKRDLRGAEWLGGFAKSDRLEPVVTIVLYYGREPWDGAKDLHQLMDCEGIPGEIMGLVNNYGLHVLEVGNYPDTDRFQTDIREVFRFIQCANDKAAMKALTESEPEHYSALEEDAFDVIAALTNSEALELVKEDCMEEGGKVNMCKAIEDMIADGRLEGMLEGRLEGERTGARSKAETVAKNMFRRGMSEEDAAAICEEDIEQVRAWFAMWRKK